MGSLYLLNSKLLHGWHEISYKIYFILVSEYFLGHEIQSDEFLKIQVYWGSVDIQNIFVCIPF